MKKNIPKNLNLKKPKYNQKILRAYKNPKLNNIELLIDLADIKRISRKIHETGKISYKVLKKWKAREKVKYPSIPGCMRKGIKHKWFPSIIFDGKTTWHDFSDGWRCIKCNCWTNYINLEELPESFNQPPYTTKLLQRIYTHNENVFKLSE